jgi:hypothetical protein
VKLIDYDIAKKYFKWRIKALDFKEGLMLFTYNFLYKNLLFL